MSSALRLVETGTSPGASPLRAGDRVRVPHAVELPSGRRVRANSYEVLQVLDDRSVVVRARPDCSDLGGRFAERGSPARDESPFRLRPGEYTALDEDLTDGRHPAYIHDR